MAVTPLVWGKALAEAVLAAVITMSAQTVALAAVIKVLVSQVKAITAEPITATMVQAVAAKVATVQTVFPLATATAVLLAQITIKMEQIVRMRLVVLVVSELRQRQSMGVAAKVATTQVFRLA
jgi:hypothetical protein